MTSGFADQSTRLRICIYCEVDEVADVPDAATFLLEFAYQCPTSRDGLQTAGIAASAGDVDLVRFADPGPMDRVSRAHGQSAARRVFSYGRRR